MWGLRCMFMKYPLFIVISSQQYLSAWAVVMDTAENFYFVWLGLPKDKQADPWRPAACLKSGYTKPRLKQAGLII